MKPQAFVTATGHAAAMPEENIDTDIIFPARFLLLTTREGLGVHAFHDRRYDAQDHEIAGYVLNLAPFRKPVAIVAGDNFGSGSSREQAVWALHDLGVRAVIAPSLGEIFHSNCLRNGVVPIVLPQADVDRLLNAATGEQKFTIDLEKQTVTVAGNTPIAFAIPGERRLAMLNGWDETDLVLSRFGGEIDHFEADQQLRQPWLHHKEPAA